MGPALNVTEMSEFLALHTDQSSCLQWEGRGGERGVLISSFYDAVIFLARNVQNGSHPEAGVSLTRETRSKVAIKIIDRPGATRMAKGQ